MSNLAFPSLFLIFYFRLNAESIILLVLHLELEFVQEQQLVL